MKNLPRDYKNFQLKKWVEIEELQVTLIEMEHAITKAQVLHLANEDEENSFNISFRTYPNSSNGAAHVLEHIILCGSEKYPIKDPFFSMTRKSLNTFMNAFTGPDFTCYPAASQIRADFYNLLEVYLDAVFYPSLREISFLQEGHHLEFSNPKDLNSPLNIKGVVYNEMKGALANPDNRLEEALFEELFSSLPYRYNSGGNPRCIRDLTYEELKKFHQKYYHPSQALFYFYGNLPLEGHLDFIEERVLKRSQKSPPLPLLPTQKRYQEKKTVVRTYPIASGEEKKEKTHIAWGWLTFPIMDAIEVLALNVIDLALMGTDAAPLRHALLQSNLCKQVDSTLEEELSEIPYIIVCKGCSEDSYDQLETLLLQTLKKIAEEGIPEHLVAGALHQLEMEKKEITGSSLPYGLALFFRSGLLKQQGKEAEEGLRIHSLFKKLHTLLKDPTYLSQMISNQLLNNPHLVRVILQPDSTLAVKELEEERGYLAEKEKKLTSEEKVRIAKLTQQLKEYQEEVEDIQILPTLRLEEIPQAVKDFSLVEERVGDLDTFSHACFTNELLYTDLFFDLPAMDASDLFYVRLFSFLVAELGSGERDYKAQLDYLFQNSGGISCELDLFPSVDSPHRINPALSIRGKALYRQADKLFGIFQDLLQKIDFADRARIDDLLKQQLEAIESSIARSPLRYALTQATHSFSQPLCINNLWYGLPYLETLRKTKEAFSSAPELLQKKLEEMKERLFSWHNPELVLTATDDLSKKLKNKAFYGLKSSSAPFTPWQNNIELPVALSQGRIIASPVAFNILALPTPGFTHPLSPALSMASQILENKWLHLRIREQGGAYGAGATYSATSGYFYFHSYRDPHIQNSLEAIHESVRRLSCGEFDKEDLLEAQFSLIQAFDCPRAPGSRGTTAYAWRRSGKTKEKRAKYRQEILTMSREKVVEAAHFLASKLKEATLVSFAGKELFEKEKFSLPIFNAL